MLRYDESGREEEEKRSRREGEVGRDNHNSGIGIECLEISSLSPLFLTSSLNPQPLINPHIYPSVHYSYPFPPIHSTHSVECPLIHHTPFLHTLSHSPPPMSSYRLYHSRANSLPMPNRTTL